MTADEMLELWDEIYNGSMVLQEEVSKYNRACEYRTPEEKELFRLMGSILTRFATILEREWEQGLPY